MSVRLKSLVALVTDCRDEGKLPYVALEHLEGGTGRLLPETELPERENPLAGVAVTEAGDVLFGKLRPYLGKSWLADRKVYASTELLCLRSQGLVETRWLAYLVNSRPFVDWAVATSDGAKMPRTSWEKLGDLRVEVPSRDLQRAIADYLDNESARIDALIQKKASMLALLEERRMTVITDGVSGQLTSASLVPSSLPWLPFHGAGWRDAKLTLIARLGSGHTPSRDHPEWWQDCTIPWITTGEVAQLRSDRVEFLYETREKISETGVANSAAEVHPAGTVVLCRTASAGYSAVMGGDMATSQDFATWTCGPLIRPRFLLLCLRAMRQDLLGRLAMGSTHKTIYMPDIEGLHVPLPDVEEQDAIVAAVWARLGKNDQMLDVLNRQITLLQEHRQGLITAAIVGNLNFPGAAA